MAEGNNAATVQILRTIPVFNGLSDADLESVVGLFKMEVYPSDSLIIREGTEGNSMYIILEGEVKISREKGDSEEVLISFLSPGAYFGELALIDSLPRSADVTSLSETKVLVLSKKDLDRMLEQNIHIANVFYRNCLTETFFRLRSQLTNVTLSQLNLSRKSAMLDSINQDLSQARTVQNYFIDQAVLDSDSEILPGVKQSYVYEPSIDVGGDFLNIVRIDEHRAMLIIADVEGHGIAASLATGVMKSAISMLIPAYADSPAALLEKLNNHFNQVIPNLYATCYCALIDSEHKTLTMAKAGHHHPLFWKKERGEFETLTCSGTGLGLFRDTEITEEIHSYSPGDRLLFFTDGYIEQVNSDYVMFGKERLVKAFLVYMDADGSVTDRLLDDLREYSAADKFDDDVTLLLLDF